MLGGSSMLELITAAEMARIDRRAAALGAPTGLLMENAGRAVVDAVLARRSAGPTIVLCGPGNNGGDGYVVARLLAQAGWPVRVATLGAPHGDAVEAAADWRGPTAPLTETTVLPGELVIDALFGAGLSRPLEGAAAALAAALPAKQMVAVDVPSGLRDDGTVEGAVFRAAMTVTFCRKKPAHVLFPGRALCGEVVLADIGVPEQAVSEIGVRAWENQPPLWRAAYPWPSADTHKHKRGRVAVASGGVAQTGAARLAARAALRAGAGLATVLSPPSAVLVNATHLTAIMLAAFKDEAELAALAETFDALVLGPAFGLGEGTKRAVLAATAVKRGLVLDADALTAFQDEPDKLFAALHAGCVLTPHEGEFRRLFPDLADQRNKLEKARGAAKRAGCVVLLKGPDTVIAAPDGRAAVNVNAPPTLATAGAGDVLAGIIAGLLGQGVAPWEAACAGAWLHGVAAELFGPGLIAEDLCETLPAALRALQQAP